MDIRTGFTQIRKVDKTNIRYEVARAFQIRLELKDLRNSHFLHSVEERLGINPEQMQSKFDRIVRLH